MLVSSGGGGGGAVGEEGAGGAAGGGVLVRHSSVLGCWRMAVRMRGRAGAVSRCWVQGRVQDLVERYAGGLQALGCLESVAALLRRAGAL
ncbi:MAG: hypothetical protein INR62_05865 [Rhodospirillales bacterium]|nr:hypothetical protein [Acetobacter sp.]